METKNIKDLEITREMYERALEVENAWKAASEFSSRTKEFKELNNEWIKLDNAFQDEVNSDFDTSEIIREYQRRKEQTKCEE